ncbi:MAG: sulfatase, partial [Thermoguttaceae bacterium]
MRTRTSRCPLLSVALLAAAALVPAMAAVCRGADRPNFVFLISEDNSVHYMKLFEPTGAPTPNIEKLAAH